ncbi:MAG: phosphotransferase [Patescibacteria group bacterium]
MEEIDLKLISKAASEKLDEPVEFVSVEKIGSGYHATGYKLTSKDGRAFFIKKITVNDVGFEYPERKVAALVLSHTMSTRSGLAPKSLGVFLESDGQTYSIPAVSDSSTAYQLQEFEPKGTNYFALLKERKNKIAVDERDHIETASIVELLVSIHKVKPDFSDKNRLKMAYMDGLRAELVHPELTMTFLHQYDEKHPFLPPSVQAEYIVLYLQLMHTWRDRSERICALHGDFGAGNTFIRTDGSAWTIDFARVPWGDPGIDIGWSMIHYIWLYFITKNPYYKELGELYLTSYEAKTGDKEIRRAAALGYVFMGFIFPAVYVDDADEPTRTAFFKHTLEILRRGEFFWPTV